VKATVFVTLLATFSVITGCAVAQPWVLAQGQHPQSFQRTVTVEAARPAAAVPAGRFRPQRRHALPAADLPARIGEAGEILRN